MNRQEIFDKAVAHAKTMEKTCLGSDGGCAYRGPNGQMCLIGALIKNEFFDSRTDKMFGGVGADDPKVLNSLYKSGIIEEELSIQDKQFLLDLQSQHDNIPDHFEGEDFKSTIRNNLENFAEIYNLQLNW